MKITQEYNITSRNKRFFIYKPCLTRGLIIDLYYDSL